MDTLMAGAVRPRSYGVDETGKAFALDANGNPAEEAPETIAIEVRAAIERGKEPVKPIKDE